MITVFRESDIDKPLSNSDYIYSPGIYMEEVVYELGESEVFNHDIVDKIVESIDKSKHLGDGVFKNDIFGILPWQRISGGSKGLILVTLAQDPRLDFIHWMFNMSIWGENCLPLLAELSYTHDFALLMDCIPTIYENNLAPTEICAKAFKDGRELTTLEDLIEYTLEDY